MPSRNLAWEICKAYKISGNPQINPGKLSFDYQSAASAQFTSSVDSNGEVKVACPVVKQPIYVKAALRPLFL